MSVADEQIFRQITGKTEVTVSFLDQRPETIGLWNTGEGYFLKPAFCNAKPITEAAYLDLCSLFTGEQEYNTDPEQIDSGMTYNEFFDRYYNGSEQGGK